MKKTLAFIVLFALIIISLIACGEASPSSNSTSSNTTQASSTPKDGKVGDTVKVTDSWTFKVNSVKISSGSDMDKPQKTGDVFLIVDASVKNLGSKTESISSIADFKLADSDGQAYNETVTTDNKAPLDGNIRANSPMTGTLAYEIPGNVKKFTLTFTPDALGTDSGTVDISL